MSDVATAKFRRQHEELLTLGLEIGKRLDPLELRTNASEVRILVARFAGKLFVHAVMENEALYPRLMHGSDDEVRTKARGLFQDVKHVYDAFDAYARRWSTDAILSDTTTFVRETRDTMKMLGKRMMRENEELYPLVDALGAT